MKSVFCDKLKKLFKNKVFIIGSVLVSVLFCIWFIDYSFNKPSPINRFIASNVYKTPANSAFKDDNFYQCVVDGYNSKNKTNLSYTTNLSDSQLKTITGLWCGSKRIKSASGIEKLTALTVLAVSYNQLTSLDVSKNTKLLKLSLSYNQLTSLDVSKNTALTDLDVSDNQLTSLDVSKNTALTDLDVSHNQLTSLDVSKNTALTDLAVSHNQLTSLDVSKNTALTNLGVSDNQLTSLDVSKNTALTNLGVSYNQLTSLDVIKNTVLENLQAGHSQLTSLDVSKNTALTYLYVSDNQLTSLYVSKNVVLEQLYASNNKLTSLDVSGLTTIKTLWVTDNQLTSLDVSKNTALTSLDVSDNQLTSLDVSKNIALTSLDVDFNKLTSLYVSKNTVLTHLHVSDNQLTSLDVSGLTALEFFYARDNNFEKKVGNVLVGETILIKEKMVKLPSHLTFKIFPELSDGIELQNNVIKTLKSGIQTYNIDYGSNNNNYSIDYEEKYIIEVSDINSNKYSIDKVNNYIVVGNDTNEEILSNVKIENGTATVNGNEFIVKNGDAEVKRFKLVRFSSNVFDLDLSKDYIYIKDNKYEYIQNNINVVNGTISVDTNNDKVIFKYGNVVLKEYNIVKLDAASIKEYVIGKDYIFVYNDTNNVILSKIKLLKNKKVQSNSFSINNGYLDIKFNNLSLERLKIIRINSNKYSIDKVNNYIVVGNDTNEEILSNVKIENGTATINGNEFIVKNGGTEVKKIKLVRFSSNVYDLDLNNDDIYIRNENYIVMQNNINVVNGTISVDSNSDRLFFKYGNLVLKEYNIVKLDTTSVKEYVIGEDYIYIEDDTNEEILSKLKLLKNNKEYSNTISINDGYLDVEYEGKKIEHLRIVGIEFEGYKTFKLNNYLYIGTDTYEDMQKNITSGPYLIDSENGKLIISDNGVEIKKYEIIRLNVLSDKYVVGNDYILVGDDTNKEILSNLQLIRSNNVVDTSKCTVRLCLTIKDGYVVSNVGFGNNMTKLKVVRSNFGDYKQYEIDGKKYLYVGTDTYKDIKKKVTFADGEVIVDETNGLLKLKKDDIEINYEIIRLKSLNDKYVLGNNYLYANNDTDNNIKSNIELSVGNNIFNSIKTLEDSYLKIKLNENIELANIKIINIFSNKYNYDIDYHDYIYVGGSIDEEIINNIETNATVSIKDNILNISYDKFSKKYTLIRVSSDVYNLNTYGIFDLEHDNLLKDIKVINGTLEVQDHSLIVKYKNIIVNRIPIVSIWSDDYKITDEYIFTGFDGREFDTSKVRTSDYVDFNISYYDLLINYHAERVGEISIYCLNNVSNDINVDEKNNKIYLNEEETYQSFMQSISTSSTSITIRIVDKNGNVVQELKSGNRLEVIYNKNVIDSYTILFNDSMLIYNDESKVERTEVFGTDYLKNLNINNTFINVKDLIQTDGIINIKDKDDNVVDENSKIKTGDKLVVKFLKYDYVIHLSVLGDVVGNGIIDNSDVNESYDILRKKKQVDRQYYLASDVKTDGKIKINDIAKLHQYVRGKITSIEDNFENSISYIEKISKEATTVNLQKSQAVVFQTYSFNEKTGIFELGGYSHSYYMLNSDEFNSLATAIARGNLRYVCSDFNSSSCSEMYELLSISYNTGGTSSTLTYIKHSAKEN